MPTNKPMTYKKLTSFILIIIMTVFPMLSTVVSAAQCQHQYSLDGSNTPFSTTDVSTSTDSSTINDMQISDMHDCCEQTVEQCDCDNGQVGTSIVNTIVSVMPIHEVSLFKQAIPPLLISKISDSLYRPPITIL